MSSLARRRQSLTFHRILPNTSIHTVPSQPRSVEILHQVSAKKSALLGMCEHARMSATANNDRFETREVAERVVKDFHSVLTDHDGIKLFLRFADTKAQKQLKLQSQERRTWRSREYSYSVEHTPSPTLTRFQNVHDGVSPASYQSPAGAGHNFTPDTSVSPP